MGCSWGKKEREGGGEGGREGGEENGPGGLQKTLGLNSFVR